MKNLLVKIWYSVLLSCFFMACQSPEPVKEPVDSTAAPGVAQKFDLDKFNSIKVVPIEEYDAFVMARDYRAKVNKSGKWGDYVRSDIPSMIKMLLKMDSAGQTHVKMYFGVSTKKDCYGKEFDNLTLFFEGAKVEGDCIESRNCDSCTLNESQSMRGLKPYNIVHPCPPPPCSGYSRYYIYKDTVKKKVKNTVKNTVGFLRNEDSLKKAQQKPGKN